MKKLSSAAVKWLESKFSSAQLLKTLMAQSCRLQDIIYLDKMRSFLYCLRSSKAQNHCRVKILYTALHLSAGYKICTLHYTKLNFNKTTVNSQTLDPDRRIQRVHWPKNMFSCQWTLCTLLVWMITVQYTIGLDIRMIRQ